MNHYKASIATSYKYSESEITKAVLGGGGKELTTNISVFLFDRR